MEFPSQKLMWLVLSQRTEASRFQTLLLPSNQVKDAGISWRSEFEAHCVMVYSMGCWRRGDLKFYSSCIITSANYARDSANKAWLISSQTFRYRNHANSVILRLLKEEPSYCVADRLIPCSIPTCCCMADRSIPCSIPCSFSHSIPTCYSYSYWLYR